VRRAVELGDGWVPFEVTLDELCDQMAYARALPAFDRKAATFDVVVPAPFELTPNAIDGERTAFTGSPEQVIEDVEAYRAAGVTGLTAGFRSQSLTEQLEKMAHFAETIVPACWAR
jgi:hypothetical protein